MSIDTRREARVLRVGTRGSALALAQSGDVARALAAAAGARAELVRVKTEGDVNQGPLASIGGTGVFVGAVRSALLADRVDVVVHSHKDLPTAPADGIVVAAVPQREDVRDALCARGGLTLQALPERARVGTGSPRRAAQLLRQRPDLVVVPVRGNVDTRLRLVSSGDLDAVVLAAAGLNRMGRQAAVTELLSPDAMLPAPGQGALAVECRTLDARNAWYAAALRTLDDPASDVAVRAERSLLEAVEAGCIAPVGALATVAEDAVTLTAAVLAADGRDEIRGTFTGSIADPVTLGRELAAQLLSRGAGQLLAAVR